MCPSKSPVIQEVTTESRTTSIKGRVQQYQRDWAKMAPRRKTLLNTRKRLISHFPKNILMVPKTFGKKT